MNVLQLVIFAREYALHYKQIVPLYLIATGPHEGSMAHDAATEIFSQAERAADFIDELDQIIIKAKRDEEYAKLLSVGLDYDTSS